MSIVHTKAIYAPSPKLIAQRTEELKILHQEFIGLGKEYGTELYVISRFSFYHPMNLDSDDPVPFFVELLNLNTGDFVYRLWHFQNNKLIHDEQITSNPLKENFYYADWAQELYGIALDNKKNMSMERAIISTLITLGLNCIVTKVIRAYCKMMWRQDVFIGFDYKIELALVDEKGVHFDMKWNVEFTSKSNSFSFLNHEVSHSELCKILLRLREMLINDYQIPGDSILDTYYVLNYDYEGNKKVNLKIEAYFRSQAGKSSLFEVLTTKSELEHSIKGTRKISITNDTVEFHRKYGEKVDVFQYFSRDKTEVDTPSLSRALTVGISKLSSQWKVREILSVECKVARHVKGYFDGFEYKIKVVIGNLTGEAVTDLWHVKGNPHTKDNFDFVDAKRLENHVKSSQFESYSPGKDRTVSTEDVANKFHEMIDDIKKLGLRDPIPRKPQRNPDGTIIPSSTDDLYFKIPVYDKGDNRIRVETNSPKRVKFNLLKLGIDPNSEPARIIEFPREPQKILISGADDNLIYSINKHLANNYQQEISPIKSGKLKYAYLEKKDSPIKKLLLY